MATHLRVFEMVERLFLNALANGRGFAAGYLRIRRLRSIVFGEAHPPLAATKIG